MRNKKLIVIFSVLMALTLLIILSSVVFSVQHINTHCINGDDSEIEELERFALDNCGIKKGRSIFTLDVDKVKKNIENKVTENDVSLKVTGIEKKFPNRVLISFVKIYEYFSLEQDGITYYLSNSGKILRIEENASAGGQHIQLHLRGKITSTNLGDEFSSTNANDSIIFDVLFSSLERLGSRNAVTFLFESIDLTKASTELKTRQGLVMEMYSCDYAFDKLRLGISTYNELLSQGANKVKEGNRLILLTGKKCTYVPK